MDLIIQTDTEVDALYLSLGSHTGEKGIVKRTQRINDDIALDFGSEGQLLGLEVLNASKNIGSPIDQIRLDQLVGVKESAALVGVQPSNFVRDYANKPGFPTPVVELGNGRIWLRSQVLKFVEDKQGRKKAS